MCGIYFSYSDRRFPQSEQEVNLSMQKIKHRGPDASGVSFFPLEDAFVALGHRRLSILDLNERSNQPFHSERYALTTALALRATSVKQVKNVFHYLKEKADMEWLMQATNDISISWSDDKKISALVDMIVKDKDLLVVAEQIQKLLAA